MNPRKAHPIDFFNQWFTQPITIVNDSVAGIIDALNRHPMANDQSAQDYVMPTSRCREKSSRFRIYGENQDVYYCFVYAGDELKGDPPVYFESSLDLNRDYGIPRSEIIDDNHVLVASRFTDFLWHILGHHICIRREAGSHFAAGVTGILIDNGIELDESFVCPLRREFPAGFNCFVSDDVICAPQWGAASLTAKARDSFVARYSPNVSQQWK